MLVDIKLFDISGASQVSEMANIWVALLARKSDFLTILLRIERELKEHIDSSLFPLLSEEGRASSARGGPHSVSNFHLRMYMCVGHAMHFDLKR